MDWFYAVNSEQKGPVSEETLKDLRESGEINDESLVWREGFSDWVAYGTVFTGSPPGSGSGQAFPGSKDTAGQGGNEGLAKPVIKPGSPGTGGMTPIGDLKKQALTALSGNWAIAVVTVLLFFVMNIVLALLPFIGGIIQLVIQGPLMLGFSSFFLRLIRKDQPDIGNLFSGFSLFGLGFGVYILIYLIAVASAVVAAIPGGVFLGVVFSSNPESPETHPLFVAAILTLVIPILAVSIWIYLRYAMAYFIALDEPENGVLSAIRKSPKLVYGKKGKLFLFGLSFIGWYILAMFTFGIGFLWVGAYLLTGLAAFYDDLGGGASVSAST